MKRQSREISSNSTEATSSSLQDILPRPIFRFESDSRQRVYNCTCKWVYDWHKRLNFPCHQATVYSRHFKRQYSTPSNLKLSHVGEIENGIPKNIEKTDEYYKQDANSEREMSEGTDSEQIDKDDKEEEDEERIIAQKGLEGDVEKGVVNIDFSTKAEDETRDQRQMSSETLLETSIETTPEISPQPPPAHTDEESKSLSGGIDSDQKDTEENEKDESDEESGEMLENAKDKDEINEENENLSKTTTPHKDFKNSERLPRPFHVFEIDGDVSRESYENELLGKVVRVVGTGYYCGTLNIKSSIGGMVKQTQQKKEFSALENTAVKSSSGLIENKTNRIEMELLSKNENMPVDEQETSYKADMVAIDIEGKHVDNTEEKSEDNGIFNDHPNGGKGIVEKVYWDNGLEELECDREKLLLFDIDETHEDIECDGCKEYPLRGIRWHCVSCPYINLCTKCYMADKHNRDHIFRRIMTSGFKGPIMPKRSHSAENGKRKEMCRIRKDCDVTAVTTNMKGKVLKFWKGKICRHELDGKKYPFQLDAEEELIANDIVLKMHRLPSLTADMVRNIPGIRVMMELPRKENTETTETYIVGTLVKYKEHDGKLELQIKWDGSNNDNPAEEQYCIPGEEGPLKLFDAGIVTNTTCRGCGKDLNGIRWKGNGDNYFCTFCNITSTSVSSEWYCGQMSGKLNDTEMERKETKVRLFEENILIKQRQGNCLWLYPGMCKDSSESKERYGKFRKKELLIPVQVQSADGYIFLLDICDLKIKREDEGDKANQFYYQDHLQNLGQDGTEYIEAKIKHGEKMHVTEIQIHLWKGGTSTSWDTSYNPSLLFILMDDMAKCLEDIISFFRNSSVPCYLACQKILLWNGDQDIGTSCGVHHSTTKQTIEKLLESGCTIFKIMSGKEEADLKYFMDMAKRYLGEEVIPVILKSNEKFKLDETTLEEARTEIMPIVSAKISDFTWVAWPSKETLSDDRKKNKSLSNNQIRAMPKKQDDRQDIDESNTETYIVNTSRPWEVKQWNKKNLSKENLEYGQWFFKTKEVKLDNIIPLILVGVSMHIFHVRKVTGLQDKLQNSGAMMKMLQYVKYLSCLLLKRGQWIFPGQFVRMTMGEIFDQTSLHYIFGRNMEEDISKKLWKDLRREIKSTSFPPEIKDGKLKLRNEYSGVNLVFYALLRTKKFVGARQLVEKGCIGIRPILIGTRTLDDLKKEWRATIDFQKEMESLAGAFNQHALSIINYIQEKDERNRHIASEWRHKTSASSIEYLTSFKEMQSNLKHFLFNEDEKSNKAGKLLLNHGYLEAAYKTENECFLENAKLKTMLIEMWYGEGYKEKKCTEKILPIFLRIFLCIIHIFVMPVMVFSLGLPSWLYHKYHVPILKLRINMVGLFSFLAAFAYMLLFDYTENGISQSEYAVLYWITNKFLDELHQIFVIRCRKSKRKTRRKIYCEYIKNIWNWLDWFIVIFCFVGSAAKYFADSESVQEFAKIMLLVSFILLNMRILNMCWTNEFLGTQLVIIQKMARITIAFMAIMLVIMMCYNVVDYALLYPNTEFTWTEIENIAKNGYWALYGNFPEDDYSNCTNNATEDEQNLKPRRPTSLGKALSPYLRAIYGFVAIVMLLNLLIAIYTKAYERVDSKSRLYWSQQQSEFLEEYTIRTIFPVHMKGLCLLVFVIYSLVFFIVGKMKKTGHENRLMRVLFFDATFDDLRTESTEEEIDGMLEVQRDTNTLESEAEDITVKQERVSEQENTDVKTSIKALNEKIQFLLTELNTIKSLSAPRGIYTSVKEDH